MTLVAFVRHGPTAWNEAKRLQGTRDIPLSDTGRRTVRSWRLPDELHAFRWVASPLSRARETARILGVEPDIEHAIREMDWGDWDGHTIHELRARFGDIAARRAAEGADLRPENGETPREMRARVGRWLESVAAHGGPTGAVTHQGVIRAVISLATGWDMVNAPPHPMEWAAVQLFRLGDGGRVTIERLNISLVPQRDRARAESADR